MLDLSDPLHDPEYYGDKGKPYPANIGDIAYKTISKNAKADGKYLPKH